MELARAASGNYAAVIGVGGDGTLHEIANGLMQASGETETTPLGVIPLGNGDDFAKVLPPEAAIGDASFDWRTAVQKIAHRETRLYDVGRLRAGLSQTGQSRQVRYFLNSVDAGFGALTVQNLASVPEFMTGNVAYFAAVLKTMMDYPALRLRIQLDDRPAFEQVTSMIVVANGRCFGSGFWVCPDALPDDGLFDIVVAEQVSRRSILRLLPKIRRGSHMGEPELKMYRAHRVVLDSVAPILAETDGELPIQATCHLELEVLPRRLRVIV